MTTAEDLRALARALDRASCLDADRIYRALPGLAEAARSLAAGCAEALSRDRPERATVRAGQRAC